MYPVNLQAVAMDAPCGRSAAASAAKCVLATCRLCARGRPAAGPLRNPPESRFSTDLKPVTIGTLCGRTAADATKKYAIRKPEDCDQGGALRPHRCGFNTQQCGSRAPHCYELNRRVSFHNSRGHDHRAGLRPYCRWLNWKVCLPRI